MRKIVIALGVLMTVYSTSTQIPTMLQAQVPAYAKWGQLAMVETHAKYPKANIVDYLHEGRETEGEETIEKFKLWLKEGNREFGVFVRIRFVTKTEKVVKITMQETDR
ncbi:DUF3889 domain-containing protein [Sporosarcina sp. HYO08]|uniref:DUF3889 domain-containing protein n=1 Tax=Sporosarcina sp. HYO08 TaxID=1759557 RepID=UPI0007962C5F|nr:DUF3889 domain-containing protein [Sporosarcina sp. HYO08]KXH82077.1 hypothetical protein AU377_05325 [Sporosarcina sp. HYO08]